jgi:L-amino acid N-acyltransferase YncA
MVAFARGLPEQDLLFLDRDIVRTAVVEQWVRDVSEGRLVTIVGWLDEAIVGYATLDRGNTRWTRHVAELRVVVAEAFRGVGLGRSLLELVFEMALEADVTKLVARMTPDQTGALNMFQRLGFEQEAVFPDHAMDANGVMHDLLILSFRTHQHPDNRCRYCGSLVLAPLVLNGDQLCLLFYESHYQELGGGD